MKDMSKLFKRFVLGVIIILGLVVFFKNFSLSSKKSIGLQSYLKNYNVVQAKSFEISGKEFLAVGFLTKDNKVPASILEIFQDKNGRLSSVYKFSPIVPKEVDYPSPLMVEEIVLLQNAKDKVLLTKWGETGADWFGTHPIVTGYKDGVFEVMSFYEGNLADDPKIKNSSWTTKDFVVKNFYNSSESAKTILTQGIEKGFATIDLTFFADSNCHACSHRPVTLNMPLK